MKQTMMKVGSFLLCCILVFCACGSASFTASAASMSAQEAADALHELGLFNGTGTDLRGYPIYELDRAPNRHEAVTMLVRLLGKEAVAEETPWTAPFTDVATWAKPYVGYAYDNGITLGTSRTTFGGKADTTVTQYLTFMLRTLGYSSETDFKWDAAWELSDKIGMTHGEYNKSTKKFTRGDMAIISYSALFCKMTSGITLYDYLVAEGAITAEDNASMLINGKIKTPYLTLYFDEALADHVSVVQKEGTPYTLEFYAVLDEKPKQHIFDITLGTGSNGNIGILDTDLGEVPAGMVMYPFEPGRSWTQDEINTVLAVQEAANGLIDQLLTMLVKSDRPEPEPTASTVITTPYCTLNFPEKWKDYLQVKQTDEEDHRVMISAKLSGRQPVLLFTLIFGGDYGEQVGAIQTGRNQYVTVNIVIEDLGSLPYSNAEMTILYEMQEAVNELIEQMPLA